MSSNIVSTTVNGKGMKGIVLNVDRNKCPASYALENYCGVARIFQRGRGGDHTMQHL